MKKREKFMLGLTGLQIIRNLSVGFRKKQENEKPSYKRALARLPDKDTLLRRKQKSHKSAALTGVALLAAGALALFWRKKPPELPGPIAAARKTLQEEPSTVIAASKEAAAAATLGTKAGMNEVLDSAKLVASEAAHIHILNPAKKKAIKFGAIGALGLTAYVILIAAIVALVVVWLT